MDETRYRLPLKHCDSHHNLSRWEKEGEYNIGAVHVGVASILFQDGNVPQARKLMTWQTGGPLSKITFKGLLCEGLVSSAQNLVYPLLSSLWKLLLKSNR